MKPNADRYVVPVVLGIAVLAMLSVTVQWAPRPTPLVRLDITMGPPTIDTLNKAYGLRFTPHNAASRHVVQSIAPPYRRCVDVAITDSTLAYLQQQQACRLKDGSYKLNYTFGQAAHYVIFTTIQATGGPPATGRFPVQLTDCERLVKHNCHPPEPRLRGLEPIRAHTIGGLTIVLTGPPVAVHAGSPVQFTFSFVHNGRVVNGVSPAAPFDAAAISLDTFRYVRLNPVAGQVEHGALKNGTAAFAGIFNVPSIYRLFLTVRYNGHPVHTSFVVDVDPAPKPTPAPSS